jgi:hypothetical protein
MFTKIKSYFHDLFTKIKTNVLNAIALVCSIVGSVLAHIDALASTLDPNFGQQLSTVLGDVKWAGRWMLTVGIVTAIAKFKALVQSPPAPPKV